MTLWGESPRAAWTRKRSWRSSRVAGGYPVPCTPDLPAEVAPALWAPELSAATVILAAAPSDYPHAHTFDPSALGTIAADQKLSNGRHLVVADGGVMHRIWLVDPTPNRALAVLIPADDRYRLRTAVAARLMRRLDGGAASDLPHGLRPTSFQRHRLALLINLLDAKLAGAAPRDIAMQLVYPRMTDLRATAWKDSPERRRTRLLIKEALALMRGGYRDLLAGR